MKTIINNRSIRSKANKTPTKTQTSCLSEITNRGTSNIIDPKRNIEQKEQREKKIRKIQAKTHRDKEN